MATNPEIKLEEYKTRKKIFKRLMKEIGLYNAWVKGRSIALRPDQYYGPKQIDITPQYGFIMRYPNIGEVINNSFEWTAAGNNQLWANLDNALRMAIFNDRKITGLEKFIKERKIKERCEEIKKAFLPT